MEKCFVWLVGQLEVCIILFEKIISHDLNCFRKQLGWYPKQRHPRLSSTENIERDSLQRSIRAWDTVTYNKKPLTLPPNFTPKFFNKSPRDTFRRVTSMLIRKSE